MWDEFVEPSSIPGLSPGAQQVFVTFLNRANRASLHPLDMRRFYGFVRYAYAHRTKMNGTTLSVLLQEHGFAKTKAETLANIYEHGLAVLRSRCPALREGKVYI